MSHTVYVGSPYQRGGFGGIFSALGRMLLPVARNAAQAAIKQAPTIARGLAKQGMRVGADVLADVVAGKGVKNTVKGITAREKKMIADDMMRRIKAAQSGAARKRKAGAKKKAAPKKRKAAPKKTKKKAPAKRKTNMSAKNVTFKKLMEKYCST